jgi:hypothetical protein
MKTPSLSRQSGGMFPIGMLQAFKTMRHAGMGHFALTRLLTLGLMSAPRVVKKHATPDDELCLESSRTLKCNVRLFISNIFDPESIANPKLF